jgi:hypothetical protein
MSLKNMADGADAVAMFSASTRPLPLSEACLLSLCASLNAPVVRLDGLPTGPARAALVVYAEQYADVGVAVAVRSLEGGEVVVMRHREALPPETGPEAALEIAVGFAEGLGFVFDEDMIGGPSGSLSAKTAALEHWQRLVGSDEVFAAPDVASPPPPSGVEVSVDPEQMPEMEDLLLAAADGESAEPVELELDELSLGHVGPDDLETGGDGEFVLLEELAPLEVAEGVIDTGSSELAPDEVVAATAPKRGKAEETEPIVEVETRTPAPAAPQARSANSPAKLSKFRRPEDDLEHAEESPRGGSALGRIQIVRKRKNEDGRAAARSRIHASY